MDIQHDFSSAEAYFDAMKHFLRCPAAQQLDLSHLEHRLFTDGRELLRQLLSAHIAARGGGDVGTSVVGMDGIQRTHKRPRPRTILTLFGPITIHRLAYSMPHVPSLFPLDAMLNLPPIKISYTLQHHLVHEVISRSFNEALEALERWTGVSITPPLAQRIVQDAAQDFDVFYTQQYDRESSEARSLPVLVLTVDGTGVLVRTEDLRRATQQKRLALPTRPRENPMDRPRREYTRRMATVASAYEVARFVRTPAEIEDGFFAPHPPRPVSVPPLWRNASGPVSATPERRSFGPCLRMRFGEILITRRTGWFSSMAIRTRSHAWKRMRDSSRCR